MALDPNLNAQQLSELASSRPDLWDEILHHPRCFPELSQWITSQRIAQGQSPKPMTKLDSVDYTESAHRPSPTSSTDPSPTATSSRTPKIIVGILIAIIVVLALVLAGMATFKLFRSETEYAYGVVKIDDHALPAHTVVIASRTGTESHSVYSLALQKNSDNDDYSAAILRTQPGDEPEEVAVIPLDETRVLSDPLTVLCQYAFDADCSQQETSPTIEFQDFGSFAWNEDEGQWTHDNTSYSTDVILGVVGQTVFGSTNAPNRGTSAIGSAPLDNITAFNRETGEKQWSYSLEKPGFVSVDGEGLVVVEGVNIPQDVRTYLADKEYSPVDARAVVDFVKDIDHRFYRLRPASTSDEAESVADPQPAPVIERALFGPAPDAIRSFDYMNAMYPFWVDTPCLNKEALEYSSSKALSAAPDEPEMCWDQVTNGVGDYQFGDYAPGKRARESILQYGHSPAVHVEADSALYTDVNGDGYEDLVVLTGHMFEGNAGPTMNVFVFNPEDPDRPLMYWVGSGSGEPATEFWFEDGRLNFGLPSCPMVKVAFEGTGSNVTITEFRGVSDYPMGCVSP